MCNCPDELELSMYIDGVLEQQKTFIIRKHLANCDACARIVAETLSVKDLDKLGIVSDLSENDENKILAGIHDILNSSKKYLKFPERIRDINDSIKIDGVETTISREGKQMSVNQKIFSKNYSFEKECSPDDFKIKRRINGLIITYDCNLACTYCYIPDKKNITMDITTAKTTIVKAFEALDTSIFSEIEIDFLGGEPLVAFDRIKEICEWAWSQKWPYPYVFFATTNGTMLTDSMKKWFHEHNTQIVLGLSYDGNNSMQDTNRPYRDRPSGSSHLIDLNFFKELWPHQPVKMTISPDTVSSFSDGIIYLHEQGFQVHANPAHGVDWSSINLRDYALQLSKLSAYYLKNSEIQRTTLLNIDLRTVFSSDANANNKYCGSGTSMIVTDVDGTDYPCQIFSPLTLSYRQIEDARNLDFKDLLNFKDDKCNNCLLKNICPTCYGINYRNNNHPGIREEALCRMFLIQILSNCRFQSDRILRIQRSDLTFEDKQIAAAAVKIMDIWHHYRKVA